MQIVCLKEPFNAPYFCKSQSASGSISPSQSRPHDRRHASVGEGVGDRYRSAVERQAAYVYRNSAAIIDADGSLLGVYRKMHIPDDPLFNEKYYFTPGDAATDDR